MSPTGVPLGPQSLTTLDENATRARALIDRDRLLQAVYNSDMHELEQGLQAGLDPSASGIVWANVALQDEPLFCSEPLRLACQRGLTDMVEVLIKAGARPMTGPRTTTDIASLPMMSRRSLDNPWGGMYFHDGFLEVANAEIADMLHQVGWPATREDLDRSLLDASTRHLPTVVAQRLAAGANVHARMTDGYQNTGHSVLHMALRIESVEERVRHGACVEVVRLLLEGGADVNALNDQGIPPLLQGMLHRFTHDHPGAQAQSEALRMLVNAGADVNVTGEHGSALTWALESVRHDALVPLLIERGAQAILPLHRPDLSLGSVLLGAVFNGTFEQVRAALNLGIDPNEAAMSLPNTGMYSGVFTPLGKLMLRREDNVMDIVDLLKAYGLRLDEAVANPLWWEQKARFRSKPQRPFDHYVLAQMVKVETRALGEQTAILNKTVDDALPLLKPRPRL